MSARNTGRPHECDCMPSEAAAAATEIGADDSAPARKDPLDRLFWGSFAVSFVVFIGVVAWQKLPAAFEALAVALQ